MFISEDFPTLDLPMKANSGNLRDGFCSTFVLLPANFALVIFIPGFILDYCQALPKPFSEGFESFSGKLGRFRRNQPLKSGAKIAKFCSYQAIL